MPVSIPSGVDIVRVKMISAFTQAAFDPLIGPNKFSEFNAGQSDRWAGVYTFAPLDPHETSRLMAWIRSLKNSGEFYAYEPTKRVPFGGVVNGMTYTGRTGDVVSFANGPTSETPLVTGDYIQIGTIGASPEESIQYFQLLEDLDTNGSGEGTAKVWPTPRSGLTSGMAVITENPVMIAHITSPAPQETDGNRLTQITISWEQK